MGLFQNKKQASADDVNEELLQIFDESYRQELRQYGKDFFEKTISQNAEQFKKDLDGVVAHINIELREQIFTKLDKQIAEYGEAMKDAQYLALQSLNRSQHALQDRYDELSKQLDAQFVEYSTAMKNAQTIALDSLNKNASSMQSKHEELGALLDVQFTQYGDELKETQRAALESLGKNAQTMQEQYQDFKNALEQKVTSQESTIIAGFEDNMASVIEHYLANALGDQYDLKSQLPSIIAQMEANKQEIVDDMKL